MPANGHEYALPPRTPPGAFGLRVDYDATEVVLLISGDTTNVLKIGLTPDMARGLARELKRVAKLVGSG